MKFLVTPAPHKYGRNSTNDMYFIMSACLLTCLLNAFLVYQLKALLVFVACFCPCVLLDFIFCSIKQKKFVFADFSSLVTGLTLTCIMPINMPWYFGLIASVIAIGFKHLFGGLGNNLFNPSALSRAVVGVVATSFSFSLYGGETSLLLLLTGEKQLLSLESLLLGRTIGAIGTTFILLILVSAIILMILKIIRWENVLLSVAGYVLIIWIFMGGEYVLPMLLSGSFMFVVVFMLSDPTSSPSIFSARCLYALIFGVISALMMCHNVLGETAVFLALLIANFMAPVLDNIFSTFIKGVKTND